MSQGDGRGVLRHRRLVAATLLTAASQIAAMGLGAGLGVVVVLRFGKTGDTDAVFAAFAVYTALLILCSSLRLSVAGALASASQRFGSFDEFVAGAIVLTLIGAVVLIGAGGPVAAALAGSLGHEALETAQRSLAILWVAFVAQLASSLGAALLATEDRFGPTSVAYAVGGLVPIAAVLTTSPLLGVLAVPLGIVAGALLSATVMASTIYRGGYRPGWRRIAAGLLNPRTVAMMVYGSVVSVVVQVNYVISLSVASRFGVGGVTLYSYAFSAAALLTGVTAATGSYVLMAPLARTWDRRRATLAAPLLAAVRAALLVTLPGVAVLALTGGELIHLLLGRSLSRVDANDIVTTFLGLAVFASVTAVLPVPLLAAYALSHHGRVALLALPVVGAHVLLTEFVRPTGHLVDVGLAASLSMTLLVMVVIGDVFGRHAAQPTTLIARELAQLAGTTALAFAPAWWATIALGGGGWDFVAAAGGAGLFVALLRVILPEHFALVRRLGNAVLPVWRARES